MQVQVLKVLFIICLLVVAGLLFPNLLANYSQAFKAYVIQMSMGKVFILLVLAFFNWFLEGFKWQVITQHICSPKQSKLGFIRGLVFIALSPSRHGQFVGRLSTIPKQKWKLAISANVLIASLQVFITLVFGLIFLLFSKQVIAWYWTLCIVLACLGYLLGLYFFKKYILKKFTPKQLVITTILSLLRYGTFILSYLVLLTSSSFSTFNTIMAISIFFVVSALTPFGVLGELGKREVTIAVIFTLLLGSVGNSVNASLSIWVINILLPSIVGAIAWLIPHKRV